MGTLGGGGLYAASGIRLWHQDVTIYSTVGTDFEARLLTPCGFDSSGLLVTDLPTPRAWQVLEEDGRRTQVPRISPDDWFDQLVRIPAAQPIPTTLKALHFLIRGHRLEAKFVEALVAAGVTLGAEPIVAEDNTAEEIDTLKRCLPYFAIFSPDERGAAALVGERPAKEQLRILAQLGPQIVALRQGKDGALIYERARDKFWRIPAAPAKVVDVTGAGNAFCGGLLAGWVETADIRQAAAPGERQCRFCPGADWPHPRLILRLWRRRRRARLTVINLIEGEQE